MNCPKCGEPVPPPNVLLREGSDNEIALPAKCSCGWCQEDYLKWKWRRAKGAEYRTIMEKEFHEDWAESLRIEITKIFVGEAEGENVHLRKVVFLMKCKECLDILYRNGTRMESGRALNLKQAKSHNVVHWEEVSKSAEEGREQLKELSRMLKKAKDKGIYVDNFQVRLGDFAKDLAEKQEPLGEEMDTVLQENLGELYETEKDDMEQNYYGGCNVYHYVHPTVETKTYRVEYYYTGHLDGRGLVAEHKIDVKRIDPVIDDALLPGMLQAVLEYSGKHDDKVVGCKEERQVRN